MLLKLRTYLLAAYLLFLVGCQSMVTADKLSYHFQNAYINHFIVVKDLRSYKHIFSDQEQRVLRGIQGNLQRAISDGYKVDSKAPQVLPILTHYRYIKSQYKVAISVVEAQMDKLPKDVQYRLYQQIQDVKTLDKYVVKMMEQGDRVSAETVLGIISLMARVVSALV